MLLALLAAGALAAPTSLTLQGVGATPSYAVGGDVDGDGRRDLVVAKALVVDGPGVYVFLGTAAGLDTEAAVTIGPREGATPYSTWEVALGDLDGDGDDDLVLALDNVGLEVHLGGPGGPKAAPDVRIPFPADTFEIHPAVVDVDADGLADIVVGTPSPSKVWVLRSTAAGPATRPVVLLSRYDQAEYFTGTSLQAVGDVDGDGFQDVAFSSSSSIWLCRGSAAGLTPAGCTSSAATVSEVPLGAAGDVDGDCFADTFLQRAAVMRGTTTGFGPAWTLPEAPSVAGLGDVDGDGYDDVALGFVSTTSAPALAVHRGGPEGPSGTADLVLGEASLSGGERMATFVSATGDLDGDGLADLFASPSTVVVGLTFAGAPSWPAPDACPEAELVAHRGGCGCDGAGAGRIGWAATVLAVALRRRVGAVRQRSRSRLTKASTAASKASWSNHRSRSR